MPSTIVDKGVIAGNKGDSVEGGASNTSDTGNSIAVLRAGRIIHRVIKNNDNIGATGNGWGGYISDESINGADIKVQWTRSIIIPTKRSNNIQCKCVGFDGVEFSTRIKEGERVLTTAVIYECVITRNKTNRVEVGAGDTGDTSNAVAVLDAG